MTKFKPNQCDHCGMSTEYISKISKGVAKIVLAMWEGVKSKGINVIHPEKELVRSGRMTSNMRNNLSHARHHGLIAKVKDHPGNWCITSKGLEFLCGKPVPKAAIKSKKDHRVIGYWLPEELTITIQQALKTTEMWDVGDFEIVEGRVIKKIGQSTLL